MYQTCLYCKYEFCIYVYIYPTMYSDTPARGPNESNKPLNLLNQTHTPTLLKLSALPICGTGATI